LISATGNNPLFNQELANKLRSSFEEDFAANAIRSAASSAGGVRHDEHRFANAHGHGHHPITADENCRSHRHANRNTSARGRVCLGSAA
jgi:hypothetical protein